MRTALPFILVLMLCIVGIADTVQAQIPSPDASPASIVKQTIGLTEVKVSYARPGMKDRKIFGDLVPYDKVWRLGANAATAVEFSTDVTLGGVAMKAGKYALLATPTASSWTFHAYPHTGGGWGSYASGDVEPINFSGESVAMPMAVESFMIGFDNLRNNDAEMYFIWESTYVGVPITVPTDETVTAAIEKTMAGPSSGDLYNAAVFYRQSGGDLNKALAWMDKSMSMDESATGKYWVMREKALIHAGLGDTAGAVAAAKKSLELAQTAGNMDFVKMNTADLKKWGGM